MQAKFNIYNSWVKSPCAAPNLNMLRCWFDAHLIFAMLGCIGENFKGEPMRILAGKLIITRNNSYAGYDQQSEIFPVAHRTERGRQIRIPPYFVHR